MERYEEITRKQDGTIENGDYVDTHPAFGMVAINRVQHSHHKFSLFGANSESHPTTVTITIKQAQRGHSLHRDWYHGNRQLINVELTALQFAELLTSFNMGDGVPCTIRNYDGKTLPEIPVDDNTEIGRIKDGFEKKVKEKFSTASIKAARKELREILAKGDLRKADKLRIAALTDGLLSSIENNIPFALDQYTEAAEKVEQEVKRELTAFTQNVVEKAGFEFLKSASNEEKQLLLKSDK